MAIPMIPNEQEVRRVQAHWIAFVRRLIWPALLLVVLITVEVVFRERVDPAARFLLTLGGVGVIVLWAVGAYFEWRADMLVITNKRLISQRGIGHRIVKMFMLTNTMYVYVDQTGLGRMLDYARIEIVAPGRLGEEVLERAPEPHLLAAQIMELSRPVEEAAPPPPPEVEPRSGVRVLPPGPGERSRFPQT